MKSKIKEYTGVVTDITDTTQDSEIYCLLAMIASDTVDALWSC